MTRAELYRIRRDYISRNYPYKMEKWDNYDYTRLNEIMYIKKGSKGRKETFSDCIIALDTETSKSIQEDYFSPEYFEIMQRLQTAVFNAKCAEMRTIKEYSNIGIKKMEKAMPSPPQLSKMNLL